MISAGAAGSTVEPLDVADEAAPAFDVYTGEDGLSTEIWSAVGVDSDGFVWAGSASSLARFDGYSWRDWPVEGARSLVRDFGLDADGGFWAVFEGDGVARLGGDGRWRIVQDLPGMRHLFEQTGHDGETQLWMTYARGLARLVDGRWVPDPANGSQTADAIATARTDQLLGRPLQWLARYNQGGLWHRDVLADGRYGPWERADLPSVQPMALTYLKRTVSGGREELWFPSYTTGLARLDQDGLDVWRAFDSCASALYPGPQPEPMADGGCREATLPSEAIYSAEVTYDRAGNRSLWLSTRGGLVRMRGEQMSIYGRQNGLPSDAVRGLGLQRVDGVDVIWSATEGGLARAAITDTPWRTVSLLGARENGTFGVMIEPDGQGGERLWVGSSQRGLALLEQGQWRYFTAAAGTLPSNGVRAMWRVEGPDGSPWRLIAFANGALFRIMDDLSFDRLQTPFAESPGFFVDHVLARHGPSGHELWVATFGQGVYRLLDGQWRQFDNGLAQDASWRVLHLLEQLDSDDRSWLWSLGIGGLSRFDGQRWEMVDWAGMPASLNAAHGLLLNRDERQELWIGTHRQGVIRLDVTDPTMPVLLDDDLVPPPPDPTIYSIVKDSRGHIYICTNNGVQRLEPKTGGDYESRVFRRADGLVHDECNSNGQFVDRADRYWVGTLGGLSLYDPARNGARGADRNTAVPGSKKVFVTAVALDGDSGRVIDGRIGVPADARELRVDFSLLSGLRESETRYRSRLSGYEAGFTDWTDRPRRLFANLPPGDYVLDVEAVDYAGIAGVPMSIDISVSPQWWQRSSVQVLSVVLVFLFLVAAVMRYNRGLRLREQQLKRLVSERTSELSQANERLTRLSYRDQLTGLANRRRFMSALGQELQRARERRHPLGLIIVDVDHFKPYNDTYGHVAGDVALAAISKSLVTATRNRDLVARLGGEEFACLIVDTDLATAQRIAERMRVHVGALTPRDLGNEVDSLTVSAGVLVRVPTDDDTMSSLLTDCDSALYRAKNDGRDRVRVFGRQHAH